MTRSPSSFSPLLGTIAAAFGVIAVVMFVIDRAELGLVALVAFLVAGGAAAFDMLVAREKVQAHGGDKDALNRDAEDGGIPMMSPDDDVPMGATADAHTDVEPVDLPRDHPARRRVEDPAAQN